MATLFSLLDDAGDRATLNESGRSELILRAPRGARMDYTAAVELRDALTAWIGGALIPTPTAPEDIRTLIRKEISRSLGILAREARGEDGYETGELEAAGLRARSEERRVGGGGGCRGGAGAVRRSGERAESGSAERNR